MNEKVLRIVLVAALFAFILAPALSYSAEDLLWNGMISVYTDKSTYSDLEPITGSVSISNAESYPVMAQRIVLQIGQGEYSYPSQFANDNILLEQSINDIWVLPKSMKQVRFSLPAQSAGNYRVDVYSWALKSKFWGSSSIFYGANSASFIVTGNATKGNAIIVRETTVFGAEDQTTLTAGPVGFPVEAGKKIVGNVFIKNTSSETKSDMSLVVSMCDWATVFCTNPQEFSFTVPLIAPGETKQVNVELVAPTIPSAYEISMKLLNGNKIESMYKNRAIVVGGTAKLRKIFISGLDTGKYSVSALLMGSPDHFSAPAAVTFENFTVTAEVYNAGTKIEEKSLDYTKISFEEILSANFALDSQMFDSLCLVVKKSGVEFEKECFSSPLADILAAYEIANPELVKVTYSYNESLKELNLALSKKTVPLNARVRIFTDDRTLFQDTVKGGTSFTKVYGLGNEDVTMTVDDFDAKRQQVFTLNLAMGSSTQPATDLSPEAISASKPTCTGQVCEATMACSATVFDSVQGACCPANCIPTISSSDQLDILETPLIVWVAIIMVILAAGVSFGVMKKIKRGGTHK